MEKIEATVLPEDTGARLDKYLAEKCGFSRAEAQRLIEEGHVLRNGGPTTKSVRLQEWDTLVITLPPLRETGLVAQDIPLDVVYEDEWLLVVNKPKGMVVHPAAGNPDGTLVNALLFHCADSLSGIGGELRPGIVHRIDKDTSGLLVVAKDDETHRALAGQFASHSTLRVYSAVVYGRFKAPQGEVDAPIGRSRTDRKKMAVTESHSKPAVTTYEVVEQFDGFAYLTLRLKTGRTHQIRVHMAQIGHPLAGDVVYGPKKVIKSLAGQCLHAGTLGFTHPASGERLCFESPLPPWFADFLEKLRRQQGQEGME